MTVLNKGEAFDLEREFNAVYDDTYADIYKYVLSRVRNAGDVADIVQNVYLQFYNRLKRGGVIREPLKYLVKTAKHEVYKNYRLVDRLARHVPVFSGREGEEFGNLELELELLSEERDEVSGLVLDEVWKFLQGGDALTYKIFVLYFEYDEKLRDIASRLAVKESTVKNRLFRTLKLIREKYDI